jgi:hypothetical protein
MNNDLLDLSFFNDEAWFHFQGYLCEFTKCADVEGRKSHFFIENRSCTLKKLERGSPSRVDVFFDVSVTAVRSEEFII